jgi:hypothetical protein
MHIPHDRQPQRLAAALGARAGEPNFTQRGPPGPLPPGHPFLNIQSVNYWSATTLADDPSNALAVSFSSGVVLFNNKANSNRAWCVRGGMNADQY